MYRKIKEIIKDLLLQIPQFRLKWLQKALPLYRILVGDKIRTSAYRKAIQNLKLRNKTALDAGCGLGIMSFFLAKAGAKKIYAVEKTPIIDLAMQTAKKNQFTKSIEFIKADLLNVKLPSKVDVIIHELIGYFCFDENIIEIINTLRNRWLNKNGVIIPCSVEWLFVPVDLEKDTNYSYTPPNFWINNPYQIDFNKLKIFDRFRSLSIIVTNKKTFLSEPKSIIKIDFYGSLKIPLNMDVVFNINKTGKISGFLGFYRIKLDEKNNIDTSPSDNITCWKQSFFPVHKFISVKSNDVIKYQISTHGKISPIHWSYNILLKRGQINFNFT